MTQKYLVPRSPYSGKFSIKNVIVMNIANPLLGRELWGQSSKQYSGSSLQLQTYGIF